MAGRSTPSTRGIEPKLQVIDGSGDIVAEPDWEGLFDDKLEIAEAKEYWRVITTELKERELLAPSNAHLIQRLVCAYLIFDRMYRHVAEKDVVIRPQNKKGIMRISLHFTALREAGNDATALESELGLTPKSRGKVTPVSKKTGRSRPSDAYLGQARS